MTIGEKRFCEYQFNVCSGFWLKFFDTLLSADNDNLQKFRLGFPEEVQAFYKYKNESGYWENLEKEFLNGNNM